MTHAHGSFGVGLEISDGIRSGPSGGVAKKY